MADQPQTTCRFFRSTPCASPRHRRRPRSWSPRGLWWPLTAGRESTDDAQIDGHVMQILVEGRRARSCACRSTTISVVGRATVLVRDRSARLSGRRRRARRAELADAQANPIAADRTRRSVDRVEPRRRSLGRGRWSRPWRSRAARTEGRSRAGHLIDAQSHRLREAEADADQGNARRRSVRERSCERRDVQSAVRRGDGGRQTSASAAADRVRSHIAEARARHPRGRQPPRARPGVPASAGERDVPATGTNRS